MRLACDHDGGDDAVRLEDWDGAEQVPPTSRFGQPGQGDLHFGFPIVGDRNGSVLPRNPAVACGAQRRICHRCVDACDAEVARGAGAALLHAPHAPVLNHFQLAAFCQLPKPARSRHDHASASDCGTGCSTFGIARDLRDREGPSGSRGARSAHLSSAVECVSIALIGRWQPLATSRRCSEPEERGQRRCCFGGSKSKSAGAKSKSAKYAGHPISPIVLMNAGNSELSRGPTVATVVGGQLRAPGRSPAQPRSALARPHVVGYVCT